MSDQVKFIKCTQDKYDKLTNVDNNALYFTTDSQRIYVGEEFYQGFKPLDMSQYTGETFLDLRTARLDEGWYRVKGDGYIATETGDPEPWVFEIYEGTIIFASGTSTYTIISHSSIIYTSRSGTTIGSTEVDQKMTIPVRFSSSSSTKVLEGLYNVEKGYYNLATLGPEGALMGTELHLYPVEATGEAYLVLAPDNADEYKILDERDKLTWEEI